MPLYADIDVPWPDHGTDPPPFNPPPVVRTSDTPHDRPLLRNYGDVLYLLPELAAITGQDDPASARPVQEYGDAAPVERTFVRRLLGALADPLTRVSDELDRLPDRLNLTNPNDQWSRFLLRALGYPYVQGMPGWAATAMLRRAADLLPPGRTEGFLTLTEAIYGRGERTYNELQGWAYSTTSTPAGITLTVAERLSNPDEQRGLQVIAYGDVPAWFEQLLGQYRIAAFRTPISVQRPSQGGGLDSDSSVML